MAEYTGLSLTWLQTSKTGFLMSSLIYYLHFDEVQGDFVGASHSPKH